jgi:hypothetical protein
LYQLIQQRESKSILSSLINKQTQTNKINKGQKDQNNKQTQNPKKSNQTLTLILKLSF